MTADNRFDRLVSRLQQSVIVPSVSGAVRDEIIQQAASDSIRLFSTLALDDLTKVAFARMKLALLAHLRKETRQRSLLESHALAHPPDSAQDPAIEAERNELSRIVKSSLIALLTPEQREVIVRHFYSGETISDIAHSMGLSRSKTSRMLAEAIALLGRAITALPAKSTANDPDRELP